MCAHDYYKEIILVSCHHHTHNYIMTAEHVVQTQIINFYIICNLN